MLFLVKELIYLSPFFELGEMISHGPFKSSFSWIGAKYLAKRGAFFYFF
jgi:hypothetical protein